jgi:hypothetical protein
MTSYEPDYCYECTAYGDDYYIDEHGDLICCCDECPFNTIKEEE